MLPFQIQLDNSRRYDVEEDSCFMSRLLVVTLDGSTQLRCDEHRHIKHCVPYVQDMEASDFREKSYVPITWVKSKTALALMHVNLTVFTLDSDVLLFRVPDVDAVISSHGDAHLFYQAENLDYPALYGNASARGDDDPNIEDYPNVAYGGLNSGQVLWRPTEMLKLAIPTALREGKGIDQLDQEVMERAISEIGGWDKTHPLSQLYASKKGRGVNSHHKLSLNSSVLPVTTNKNLVFPSSQALLSRAKTCVKRQP